MKTKYIIQDWAGNILNHKGRFERPTHAVPLTFDHFDAASDWLSDTYGHLSDKDYEDTMNDLYIEELKGEQND